MNVVVVRDINGHEDLFVDCIQISRVNVDILYLQHFSHADVYAQSDFALFSFT
jgi:hypothetical protein